MKVIETKKHSCEGNVRCLWEREREKTHNLTQETLNTKLQRTSRCRREHNVNIDFGYPGCEIVGLMDLATGRDPSQTSPCFHTTQLLIQEECFTHPTQSPPSESDCTLLRNPEVLYSILIWRLAVQPQAFHRFLPFVQDSFFSQYPLIKSVLCSAFVRTWSFCSTSYG
jgi:hypothetical protein